MSDNLLSSEAVVAIAAAVKDMTSLKELELGYKHGKSSGSDLYGFDARQQCYEQLEWMGPGLKMS